MTAEKTGRVVDQGISPHPHENEALEFLRTVVPGHDPYLIWAFVELAEPSGSRYELDALVLGYHALYLIEIKSHPARFAGDAVDWTLTFDRGGSTVMENPLRGAQRKARVLGSLLDRKMGRTRPWVEPLVFLSHSEATLALDESGAAGVVTRATLAKALTHGTYPGANPHRAQGGINRPVARAVTQALKALGLRASQGAIKLGDLLLAEVIEEGPGYQDREARHERMPEVRRRVRSYLVPQSPTQERRDQLRRAAEREARLLTALAEHPRILRFHDYVATGPFAGPCVVFDRFEEALPLDAFLRQNPTLDLLDRLEILEQIADALEFCHRKKILHRGLHPGAVLVRRREGEKLEVRLYNFQLAMGEGTSGTRHLSAFGTDPAALYRAPELEADPGSATEASDVFSLGCLAYLMLTRRPPGADLAERHRLLAAGHLSLSVARDDLAASGLDDDGQTSFEALVASATDVNPLKRDGSPLEWVNLLLSEAFAPAVRPEQKKDPLEARPGDVLGEGLEVVRLLGSGSTARVFLVKRGNTELALKVALSPELDDRLQAEAEALDRVKSDRIVPLVQALVLGGRSCLLLGYAGESLAELLRRDGPQSLDYARRWGDDLLLALQALEEKGVLHRDVKPANVGVADRASKQARHLLLFDFSLAAADPALLDVGTPPYRDPFLRDPDRGRWDAAADRFAAAVTLHELLTATRPRFGTGEVAAAYAGAEATIDAERFDASARDRLHTFFRKALARSAAERHSSAERMRNEWGSCFDAPVTAAKPVTEEDTAQDLAAVGLDTPIAALPLSGRAKNALDRSGVIAVRELLRLPKNHLSAMRGVGRETGLSIVDLVEKLSARFPDAQAATEPAFEPAFSGADGAVAFVPDLSPEAADALEGAGLSRLSLLAAAPKARVLRILKPHGAAAELLAGFLRAAKAEGSSSGPATIEAWLDELLPPARGKGDGFLGHMRLLFGLDGDEPPPRDASDLARRLGKSRQLIHLSLTAARESWEKNPAIPELHEQVGDVLTALGGAAPLTRLAEALATVVPHAPGAESRGPRAAEALVRIVGETGRAATLTRVNGVLWLGQTAAHAESARALGRIADELARLEPLPSAEEVQTRLLAAARGTPLAGVPLERLVGLAAEASEHAARSARLELYPRGMSPSRALALCAGALGAKVRATDVETAVRARYPEAAPLPPRPELDALLEKLDLTFRDDEDTFVRKGALPGTSSGTAVGHRRATTHTPHRPPPDEEIQEATEFEERLRLAAQKGSFKVLEVSGDRSEEAIAQLSRRLGVTPRSLEAELLAELDRVMAEWQIDGEVVLEADRAGRRGEGWTNLCRLAEEAASRILPKLLAAPGPLVLTHPGALARYGLDRFLAKLIEASGRDEGPAAFLVVPAYSQAGAAPIHGGAGHSITVPLMSPAQRVRVPVAWIENKHRGGLT